jgi:hypothetical protein
MEWSRSASRELAPIMCRQLNSQNEMFIEITIALGHKGKHSRNAPAGIYLALLKQPYQLNGA